MTRCFARGLLAPLLMFTLLLGCDDPREPGIEHSANLSHPPTLLLPGIDPQLPSYEAAEVPPLGTLYLVAEAATLKLARHWAAALNAGQDNLEVEVVVGEPVTGTQWWERRRAPAVALLRQPLSPSTFRAFEREWGHPASRLRVGMDPTVVVAQRRHPVVRRGLSLAELAALFGGAKPLADWGALGLGSGWERLPITAHGPEAGADAAGFRAQVLERAPYRHGLVRHAGSRAVVAAVAETPTAIGYAPLSALTDAVAVVPILRDGRRHRVPSADEVAAGDYPLPAGFVYLYVNRAPAVALDAPQRELVRFLYSREGQQVATNLGLLPLSAPHAAAELQRLDIRLVPEDTVLASSRPATPACCAAR